jgi:sigma-B regulation protein RsbU (phosphoserine phosphatase)
MLPSKFPAFPDRKEFDLYATMTPAKEVGGDFYDFFFIDEKRLALVIADVSGKGVPGALFMMSAKIILQSIAMQRLSPSEVLYRMNKTLCSNNDAQMFVTVWMGILEISTGKLTAANAGHEYPILKQPGGAYEIYKDKHGFVIGGMDEIHFKEYELVLQPGAKLFVYTDGVPEATNGADEMFGTERMLDALNREKDDDPEQVLRNIHASVDRFVQGAEQFDDLTMMCIEYRG